MGATDELSSALGLAREFASDVKNQKVIEISKSKALHIYLNPLMTQSNLQKPNHHNNSVNNLQIELQDIGSAVATPKSSATERKLRNEIF